MAKVTGPSHLEKTCLRHCLDTVFPMMHYQFDRGFKARFVPLASSDIFTVSTGGFRNEMTEFSIEMCE